MKIAIVLPVGFRFCPQQPHSIETVVRTFVSGPDFGHTSSIISEAGGDRDLSLDHHQIHPSPARRFSELCRVLSKIAPDYIEFHHDARTASRVARQFPQAVSTLYRHNYMKPPRTILQRFDQKQRYRSFDRFVFVSADVRADFIASFPTFTEKSYTICNPVNAALWLGDPDQKDNLITFCGRALPEKGLAEVCDGLASVLPTAPLWRAELVLGGYDQANVWANGHIERLINSIGSVSVRTNCAQTEVRSVLARSAIALTPSRWKDPFPLAALEAHAAGAAVISSGTGGLPEISGPHAFYLPEVSSTSIAKAIRTLIQDVELRRRLQVGGQQHVRANHSVETRANQLNALRETAVATKRLDLRRLAS